MADIQKMPEHVNLALEAVRNHVPAEGDVYVSRDARYGRLIRLGAEDAKYPGRFAVTVLDPLTGKEVRDAERLKDTVSDSDLKTYYRPVFGDLDETLRLARMVADGDARAAFEAVAGADEGEAEEDAEAALVGMRHTKEEISAMLEMAERQEDRLQEVRRTAELIVEQKRRELENKLDQMNGVLAGFKKKVQGLVRIITVLNLYTGRTLDVRQIADGEAADPSEMLHLRQRILYMDEELCAHLDHEADYKDISLFFEWVKDPANRDIVIPERRSVVALKAKRWTMGYRSGDPNYDAQREAWNKHTYLLIRNGERLYCVDSDDLECCDWVFPHKDHEEAYAAKMANPGTSFKDHEERRHKDENYRVMRFAMTVQGLLDRDDILGPVDRHPNIIKNENVVLVRDDEDVLGTPLAPFRDFRKAKNALLRRGSRVLYAPGETWREGGRGRRYCNSGDYRRYYAYESSEPETPNAGVYNLRQEKEGEKFWFSYLPGGEVWPRSIWEDAHERRRNEGWTPSLDYCLNYDAVTSAELQAYFDDRTQRVDFRNMMPVLKRALLEKKREEADEEAFKDLMLAAVMEDGVRACREDDARKILDEAVAWWKEKVIFTRPLRSDDAKAWRMIKGRLLRQLG